MEESLTTEHASELLGHTLPELLDGGGVAKEHGCHLETLWWDVTHRGLDVVGDPLNKVARVLVLGIEHLLGELGHGESTVLLGSTGGEWSEASEEEMKTGEWHKIDSKLTEVRVELTREAN